MGRKRTKDRHLPQRMYQRRGTYYYVVPGSEKWVRLSRRYAELTAAKYEGDTVALLIDRYMVEVAPDKAERTYEDNIRQASNLRKVFGEMRVGSVTQQHLYGYQSERAKSSRTQANRELALFRHMIKRAIRWGIIAPGSDPFIRFEMLKETPRQRLNASRTARRRLKKVPASSS
ncbi:MAG: hypothetical protein AAGA68_25370 [Pseudomonadota bacterium]